MALSIHDCVWVSPSTVPHAPVFTDTALTTDMFGNSQCYL